MSYEFAERGNITLFGMDGIDIAIGPIVVGEYTTLINTTNQNKKHIIKDLDFRQIKDFLKDNGKPYKSPFWDTPMKKIRYVQIKEKFVDKLNKENLVIIDKEWLKG